MKQRICTLVCLSVMVCMLGMGTGWAKTVRIGLMCPLTGSWASEGQDMKQIVEMLVAQSNEAGGINGIQVDLVVEDDGGDPRQAALAATRLTTKDIAAVIGTYGSSCNRGFPEYLCGIRYPPDCHRLHRHSSYREGAPAFYAYLSPR